MIPILTLLMMFLTAASLPAAMHVPASVALAAAEIKPQPEYSPLARQMRVTGEVSVELQIGASGRVDSVTVLNGNMLLSAPVVKALKGWKFKPFLQDGQPTIAITVLRFSFK
jgi:periplasmic protein TonB